MDLKVVDKYLMGFPACRLKDMTMGHGCYSPQVLMEGSKDVFIEGIPAHRVGDKIQPHCCHGCHPSTSAKGSPTVYINGVALMRVGDSADCGSRMMTGALTVKAG
jgi:uncharacterized Zn-binding protein involved in type VI secretion